MQLVLAFKCAPIVNIFKEHHIDIGALIPCVKVVATTPG